MSLLRGSHLRRPPLAAQVVALSTSVTALQGIIGLATAKWLGASDRGVLSIAQTITTLAMLIISGGLIQGTRVLLADPNSPVSVRRYLSATRIQTVLYAGVAALLSVTALRWLGGVTAPWVAAVWVAWSVALFRFSHLREVLHGLGHHVVALRTEVLACLVGLLLVTGWWLAHPPLSLGVAMAGIGLGYAVGWLVQRRGVALVLPPVDHEVRARSGGLGTRWRDLRTIVTFCFPGLIAALGLVVASRMDQLILAGIKGTKAVGVYAMASTISDLAWGIPLAMSAVIIRQARQADARALPAMHRVAWLRIVGATAALSLLVVAGGWVLLEVFLGGDFRGSTHVVAILVIGSLAMASQQVDLSICAGLGDLRASAIASWWGIVIGLVAYLVLIPALGVVGCALANDITFVTMAVAARLVLMRRLRKAGLR